VAKYKACAALVMDLSKDQLLLVKKPASVFPDPVGAINNWAEHSEFVNILI